MEFQKFVDALPSAQNAVDIFKDHWACALPAKLTAGAAPLFESDPRPAWALKAFGADATSFDGAEILELGPLEAAHTYKMEQMGARITAVEGNAEAFLKCLIVKEIFGLKSKFLLGNFTTYLEENDRKFDLLFASGVLYHMLKPLRLIQLICERSDRSFLWSHYFDPDVCEGFVEDVDEQGGFTARHYRKDYLNRQSGNFWGGLGDGARWLPKDDLISAFKFYGHDDVEIIQDAKDGPNGPSISLVTRRTPV